MKILRCPRCGVWPATDISIPKGKDAAGFTTVTQLVRCPGCGNSIQGDPRDGAFQQILAQWKANLEEMEEPPESEEARVDRLAAEADDAVSEVTDAELDAEEAEVELAAAAAGPDKAAAMARAAAARVKVAEAKAAAEAKGAEAQAAKAELEAKAAAKAEAEAAAKA
ncbi:MAG TPA: hypothetical protein VN253_25290 [Kofleriaceae bacterium]|nr:hypothetical protein [Kofleriaceae bacterium]